ncbi:hypothetical protein GVN21_03820 [Caulobacter sp. SLTY]|uniref:hypothetical protein n=1 Tax=Caulobacter sp. SLTY TaxID=2683262 RepID=UPI0014125D99|nr:hypothetical protein [Caulobacter sp. SLTY]NBB14485.1 hypothetical protein [Caulobacter sp. SLTY]
MLFACVLLVPAAGCDRRSEARGCEAMPAVPVKVGAVVYEVPAALRPTLGLSDGKAPQYPSQGRQAGLAIVCLGGQRHLTASETGISIHGLALTSQASDGGGPAQITWLNIDADRLNRWRFPSTGAYPWKGLMRVDRGSQYHAFGDPRTAPTFIARCTRLQGGDSCRLFVQTADPDTLMMLDIAPGQSPETWPATAKAAEALRVSMRRP